MNEDRADAIASHIDLMGRILGLSITFALLSVVIWGIVTIVRTEGL